MAELLVELALDTDDVETAFGMIAMRLIGIQGGEPAPPTCC